MKDFADVTPKTDLHTRHTIIEHLVTSQLETMLSRHQIILIEHLMTDNVTTERQCFEGSIEYQVTS